MLECSDMSIILFKSVREIHRGNSQGKSLGKFLREILRGNSYWKFHTTTNDHYKKSDSVLVKSLVPFHGQVNKALRSISHWLVSLLAPIFGRPLIQP